ncbi:MAG: hypothetical protein RLZZ316_2199 [Bacteroidota bacterium]|jgi:hypothetical protein
MLKRNWKKVMLFVIVLAVLAALVGYYQLNKPHKQASVKADVEITAINLATAFETNEATANETYLDKVVAVTGQVSEISTNQQGFTVIVLKGTDMSGVSCTLLEKNATVEKNSTIRLQGFCNGYLTDVVLNRCILNTLK